MGKYDDYKKLTLPLSVVKKFFSTRSNMSGLQATGATGNEGIVLADWIQERIDDGTIDPGTVVPIGTNLTNVAGTTSVQILSDTGTDTTIDNATSLRAGVMTAADKISLTALETLTGVPVSSTTLGTFTGSIIPDNVTIKVALQSLETTLGSLPGLSLGDLISADTAITVTGGTNAVVSGDTTFQFNPGNVDLDTLGGNLLLSQLDTTGATTGQFITFDGTNFVASTYTPPAIVHNNTTGIQGGIATEYYHLPLSSYTKITNTTANKLLGRVSTAGEVQELGLTGSLEFNSTNLRLVNDSTTPGNSMYYGTNGSGVKGWYSSLVSGTVTNVSATNSADLTFTITNPTTTPDITAILTNTGVVAGTYGNGTNIPQFTVNSKGRITSAVNVPLALTSSNISDFDEAVDDRVTSLLVAGTNITLTYDDTLNTLTIDAGSSGLTGTGAANRIAYWTSPTNLTYDDDFTFDGTYATIGTNSPASLARLTTKGLGNSLSTYGIVHQSLSGTEVFKVADNGAVQIGALGEIYLHPDAINLQTGTTFPINVIGDLYINSDKTVIAEGGGIVSYTPSFKSIATRSGTAAQYNAEVTGSVTYTAGGSHAYADLYVDTNVNQTLHTGPIRSVYIDPNITAANNYIGLEINASGHTALKTTGDVSFTLGGDAEGDLYYRDADGNLVNLGIGGPTEVLGSTGTVPAWTTTAGSLPGGTNGDVLMYAGGAWVSASPIVEKQTGITGTGVTLGATPLGSLLFILYRNGIYQDATDDYSIMGNAITLNVALVSTDKITAIYYT